MEHQPSSARAGVLEAIAQRIAGLSLPHPVRVAIDGRTASGKTTFANELEVAIERLGRPVIRTSVDGFHRPRRDRYRQGRFSSAGYYEDARDLDAIRALLLEPLGPNGNLRYAVATFDLQRDERLEPEMLTASSDAVLIVDGTFLQREELRSGWDFVVFLDVPEEEARRRGVARDSAAVGGEAHVRSLYDRRYGPAFNRYETECGPVGRADVVIDNSTGSLSESVAS